MLVSNKRTGVSGGGADSGVPGGVMLALLLDRVDLRLKLNLRDDRRCDNICVSIILHRLTVSSLSADDSTIRDLICAGQQSANQFRD